MVRLVDGTMMHVVRDNDRRMGDDGVRSNKSTVPGRTYYGDRYADLDMGQLKWVRLDTNVSPNQGATVSSSSIHRGGPQVRAAAAEARLALLTLASNKLGD